MPRLLRRWITPGELPTATRCYRITLPDHPRYYAMLRAVMYDMTLPENWEAVGTTIAPCDAAEWAQVILTSLEAKIEC